MGIKFPLGIDIFEKLILSGSCYIDKTLFICKLLNETFEVSLITRPRRFGKTLTLSMLEDFFDISRDSKKHFEDLAVSKDKYICENYMNKYPVLFFTLKSVEGNDFESAISRFKILISGICNEHIYLETSDYVDNDDKAYFKRMKTKQLSLEELSDSLFVLTRLLKAHYGKQVILLIDEYDVPLSNASENGYYKQMLDVIRSMFGKTLKTNKFLKFAVITGCLRIAKESIFTGINNLVTDSITCNRFDEYIGFTESDVQKILKISGFENHAEEIKNWYNGYRFGSANIYCPWDVLNHVAVLQINPNTKPKNYWENTSHNGIIRKFIERKDLWEKEYVNEDFEVLINGGYIVKRITENLTYDMLHSSADNLWSLLYMTGYLTMADSESDLNDDCVALRIPNEEIRKLFKSTVKEWFNDTVQNTDRKELFSALWGQDEKKFKEMVSDLIFDTISYYDYKEDFYHAFMAGILSYAGYKVKSNREQGEGRSDIFIYDERKHKAAIIEIKYSNAVKDMGKICEAALNQIHDRKYAVGLEDEYDEIIFYGICFFKKRCEVKSVKYK